MEAAHAATVGTLEDRIIWCYASFDSSSVGKAGSSASYRKTLITLRTNNRRCADAAVGLASNTSLSRGVVALDAGLADSIGAFDAVDVSTDCTGSIHIFGASNALQYAGVRVDGKGVGNIMYEIIHHHFIK